MTTSSRSGGQTLLGAPAPGEPALVRAVELGRCAALAGFDWPEAREVRAKVLEELAELDAAVAGSAAAGAGTTDGRAAAPVVEELGDLLFAIANWGRHLGADPQAALAAANAKFERRFAWMERAARERGVELAGLSGEGWEALWRESKSAVG